MGEQLPGEAGPAPEQGGPEENRAIEEMKVAGRDLVKTVNDLIHNTTVRRITIVRQGRTLVDLPLPVGIAAGVILGIYLPVLTAIAGVGALLLGCTVRVERDEPPAVP